MHSILGATVFHKRHMPRVHAFTYRVFYVDVLVSREGQQTPCRFFSYDQFNVFSLYTRDYGARDGVPWHTWFVDECVKHGVTVDIHDRVRLITHPRLFGYAFNPISFWLLESEQGGLRAVVCEANNTFGHSHTYFLAHEDGRDIAPTDVLTQDKKLYVSPFNTMEGYYTFTFLHTPTTFTADICYLVDEQTVLTTAMSGTRERLTPVRIGRAVVWYPCMTFMVAVRIHLQALCLWLKKCRIHYVSTRTKKFNITVLS